MKRFLLLYRISLFLCCGLPLLLCVIAAIRGMIGSGHSPDAWLGILVILIFSTASIHFWFKSRKLFASHRPTSAPVADTLDASWDTMTERSPGLGIGWVSGIVTATGSLLFGIVAVGVVINELFFIVHSQLNFFSFLLFALVILQSILNLIYFVGVMRNLSQR